MRPKRSAAAPEISAVSTRRRASLASDASPASINASAESAMTTSRKRHSTGSPRNSASASATSTALPAVRPRHWFMSVSKALQRRPAPSRDTCDALRQVARVLDAGRNAPEPTLTSMTSICGPAANFFDRIEAVISGMLSTVAVTSRMA